VCKVGGNNPKYQSEPLPDKIYLDNLSNHCNHTSLLCRYFSQAAIQNWFYSLIFFTHSKRLSFLSIIIKPFSLRNIFYSDLNRIAVDTLFGFTFFGIKIAIKLPGTINKRPGKKIYL
jgi:hypothetical protein